MSDTTTPRPWMASQYLDNGEWGVVSAADGTIVVALSARLTEADARLIAAAPELLRAAKRARDKMQIEYRRLQPEAAADECWYEIESLSEAIEQAEGRS